MLCTFKDLSGRAWMCNPNIRIGFALSQMVRREEARRENYLYTASTFFIPKFSSRVV